MTVNLLFSLYNFHENWAKPVVSHYIKPESKVLIIPFSFGMTITDESTWEQAYGESGKYYNDIIHPFLAYGIKEENIKWLNYFKDKRHAKNKIKNNDILFFTGGYPNLMIERLIEFDITHIIETFNGVIIGCSAGAMIQVSNYHILPDEDYETFSYQKGLNLIRDFDIEVHYKRTEFEDDYITKVLKEKIDTIYAITDQGGIVFDQEVKLIGDVCIFCM